MALPGEVDDLKFNLKSFGSGCLVHFWSPFGSLCGFKALIGPYLGSLEPHNFVRECISSKSNLAHEICLLTVGPPW